MKIKYLKENFEPIVLSSKNYTEILLKLGMCGKGNSRCTLKKFIKLYNIDITHFETPKDRHKRTLNKNGKNNIFELFEILICNSTYTNVNYLKNRLYNEGLKQPICEKCGQDENWHGEHISLILDHINGINNDHRIENLRILCPNCNATLPTHCRGARGLKLKLNKVKNFNLGLNQRKTERPIYKQLLNEINELGYCGTGRKYGVSDNTIRKWKRYYEKYNVA